MQTLVNPSVSRELADAVELAQNNFVGRLKQLDSRVEEFKSEEGRRKSIAVWLKIATVVCGLILATGFVPALGVQILGTAVLAIVGIEHIFANHERVLGITSAKNACQRIRRQVEDQHQREIVGILPKRDSQPEDFAQLLIELNERLRSLVATTVDDVENALEKKNYELLGRLQLEEKPAGSV